MRMILASVKGLVAAAALAATGCTAPDSSALFRPAEPGSIRTETPGIEGMPDASPSDAGNGSAGAAGSAGSQPPSESPVAIDGDAEAPLEPPAPSEPALDAAAPSDPPAPDAGSEPPLPPEEPDCGGALLDGICWYLGDLNQSCDSVCATRGGFDPASTAWIGTPTQGGSIVTCAAILEALGETSADVTEGFREDGLGFGCHLFLDGAGIPFAWWLTAPAFSPAASDPSARLACGCAG